MTAQASRALVPPDEPLTWSAAVALIKLRIRININLLAKRIAHNYLILPIQLKRIQIRVGAYNKNNGEPQTKHLCLGAPVRYYQCMCGKSVYST